MDKFLIFDLGAGSGRAILGTLENDKLSFEEIHRFDNRPVIAAGELYWDVLRLYSEIKAGIELSKKYGKVRSIGIDTWGCDFGLIDKNGRLIGNPVHYRDRKRHERADKLHKLLPEKDLFMMSGGPQDKIMGIYQLFSLKYEDAVEYKNAAKFLMIPDIFNYFLTGEVVNEFTNATMTLMVDLQKRQWNKEIFDVFGFDERIFTPLSEAGKTIGVLRDSVCAELEIDPIPVVLVPTHDTAGAVAGIPTTDSSKNWGFGILGTWCMSGVETAAPVINEAVLKTGFGNEGGVEGKNMLLKNITGMWIIQNCREKWMKDQQSDVSWDDINDAVRQAEELNSFIDVDEERFGKVQPDMPGTIAAYCQETGQNVPSTMGEIARCFYESLVLKFKKNFSTLQELTGEKLEVVHLIGGGVKNTLFCQWMADALGVTVVAGPVETTSVGNIIFQLKACGLINNVQEGRQLCSNSFELQTYQPSDTAKWEEKYAKYLKLIQ